MRKVRLSGRGGTGPDRTTTLFAFITDVMRSAGTDLYGRRMYDTMAVWGTDAALAAQPDPMGDFANVWSSTPRPWLRRNANTRLERHFDPGPAAHASTVIIRWKVWRNGERLVAAATTPVAPGATPR